METIMKTKVKAGNRLKIWEIALLLGVAVCLLSGARALHTQDELADKVVRLHVLANSDSEEDQALKLKVRDVVLERATAILEESPDRREAESRLRGELLELERIAAEIEQDLQNSMEREINSEVIGEKVMERLRSVDQVAYVRFASVYRQFKDIDTFMAELNKLLAEK